MTIIIKTIGGLGNQLFQYAFGRAVSSKLKTDLLFDVDTSVIYKDLRVHEFCLGYFNTKVKQVKRSDLFGFIWLRRQKRVFSFLCNNLRLRKIFSSFYYVEKTFAFDKNVFLQKQPTYFEGFWQTERYFREIESEIRKEVIINKPLSEYSAGISTEIQKTDAVSLHVRRADYVTHDISNKFHGVCPPEYYENAIAYIVEKVPKPHFFMFSDDYDWVVNHFKDLPHPFTCIKNGADKNYEDLTLMSQCKHHIIANSSFSWWGAWLNPRKDKIVIAPKRWHAHAPKNDTKDLIPEGWIKI